MKTLTDLILISVTIDTYLQWETRNNKYLNMVQPLKTTSPNGFIYRFYSGFLTGRIHSW
jgi:hypothetical protein